MSEQPIRIKAVKRPNPNVRRLARALLRLVEQTDEQAKRRDEKGSS